MWLQLACATWESQPILSLAEGKGLRDLSRQGESLVTWGSSCLATMCLKLGIVKTLGRLAMGRRRHGHPCEPQKKEVVTALPVAS